MPSTTRVPTAVIGAHTRALAVEALSIPASGSAFLLLFIELNHIGLSIPLQELLDEIFEPSDRDLPSLVLRIPFRFRPSVSAEPFEIVIRVRKTDE